MVAESKVNEFTGLKELVSDADSDKVASSDSDVDMIMVCDSERVIVPMDMVQLLEKVTDDEWDSVDVGDIVSLVEITSLTDAERLSE